MAHARLMRITTAGTNSRVIPGLDFSDNVAVWAAMDEYERRQLGDFALCPRHNQNDRQEAEDCGTHHAPEPDL